MTDELDLLPPFLVHWYSSVVPCRDSIPLIAQVRLYICPSVGGEPVGVISTVRSGAT